MDEKRGPWIVKSSEVKYRNRWMEVTEDRVITPGGKPGIFGTAKILPGISVIALDKEGFVYLTEEFHYALGKNSTEVVSGGMEKSERPLEAARRELVEELGIEAREWIDLGVVHPFTTQIASPAYLFLARDLAFVKSAPERTELIRPLRVSFDEAVKMVMDGRITNGPSCVLILKAKGYLKK